MSRAVVLSGGGPVGTGWATGLAFGLSLKGVELTSADAVFGTSAGTLLGARLALGDDLFPLIARHRREASARRRTTPPERRERRGRMAAGLRALSDALAAAATEGGTPEEVRARVGRFALAAEAVPEERFLARFSELAGRAWPPSFACTAIDAVTGELVVWDEGSGVALDRAVASSCAVPGLYPPITVGGRRYIDGGMRSATNADLAVGRGRVIVISVMPPVLPGHRKPTELPLICETGAELGRLEASGSAVTVIGPGEEILTITGAATHLMDLSRVADAVEAGIRQGEEEAARIQPFWEG
jgi:NTE family protein